MENIKPTQPQRREGTITRSHHGRFSQEEEKHDTNRYPDGNIVTRKRRSTFDPEFKGWLGPVSPSPDLESSSVAMEEDEPARVRVYNRSPSGKKEIIDNNYYRAVIRRSISECKQIPWVPIVPPQVSEPDIDWESITISYSKDSREQRRFPFGRETQASSGWMRPSTPSNTSQQPRAVSTQSEPASMPAGMEHGRRSAVELPSTTRAWRNLRANSMHCHSSRKEGSAELYDQIKLMRAANLRIKQQINDLKYRQQDKH